MINKIYLSDYQVNKHGDFTHVKMMFGSDLYQAKSQIIKAGPENSPITDSVIAYLEKCFSYALYQTKGNVVGLKKALEAIIPNRFGDHARCPETWCGYHRDPLAYRHAELPNGKNLQGDGLRSCLNDIMKKYTTPEMLKKIAPLSLSQMNECANSVIGTKSLKIRYYGGSEVDLSSSSQ